ncbi:hypothetical protein WJX81_000605 [Elliptochloris bilobata]|uniref:Uncharacterized protein n=1 Tax=Elliptochloris bilobata TaxID=381761 RepID=A0AAW1RVV2_9CHLO
MAPAPLRAQRQALRRGVFAEGGLGGVGSYLAEAASAIFKPTKSDVPWEGTASPFSGRITHHDEVARLKKVYELVKEARQTVQGCTDPSAANYDPSATSDDGSCTFVFEEAGKEVEISGTLHDYVTSTLRSLWGSNFSSGDGDKNAADFKGTSFGYSGDKVVSQRDIQRLLSYERVVKQALDKAEQEAK